MDDTELYAVTGRPVLHSLSPPIFERAFAAAGRDAVYLRLAARTASEAFSLARRLGVRGLNVTAPFKEAAFFCLNGAEETCARLGVVNAVRFDRSGRAVGYNTDVHGARAALRTCGCSSKSDAVVVLGTGGAGVAAAAAAIGLDVANVILAGRDEDRAARVAERIGCKAASPSGIEAAVRRAGVIVCCVPPHARVLEAKWLTAAHTVLDASYVRSAAREAAGAAGAGYLNGLTWLAASAAASFEVFTGESARADLLGAALEASRGDGRRGEPVLLGMPGAGKTSVGRELARLLELEFVDTDAEIEGLFRESVVDIFEGRGERAFREAERQVARRALTERKANVVALGGGSVELEETMRSAKRRTAVWLFADPPVCAKRTADGTRPLLRGEAKLGELERISARRKMGYARAASVVMDSSVLRPKEIAKGIADEMHHADIGRG